MPSRLNRNVASFQEFAEVCQSLSQTGSRLQMADLVGEFLARLGVDEAEIAARFMVGRSLAQGEEKRLQISGRAIWKIVAAMTGTEEQGGHPGQGRAHGGDPGESGDRMEVV